MTVRTVNRMRASGDCRDLDVELGLVAGERLFQDVLDALTDTGVVAIARYEDETGDQPPEGVGPQEEAQPLAVLEMQDADQPSS